MKKKKIFRSAKAAFLQVVITGIFLFLLYRFLLDTIGVDQLGVWSIVLATTSISRITELGLTGSVVKYVAKYVERQDHKKAGDILQTAVLSIAVFLGIVLCVLYIPLLWFLAKIVPLQALSTANEILPYALTSLWVAALSGVFLSGLDGCLRTDLRALFNINNSVLTLFLAFVLVPKYGLLGMAYVQLSMSILLLLLSWAFLRLQLNELPYFPYKWNLSLFKMIIRYGINFQAITLFTISFDPITKALLSKYGDLASVGYYEMASRMVLQFRALLASPNQVLVPVMAGLEETGTGKIKNVYGSSYRLQIFISLLLFSGLFSLTPVISLLWIGDYEKTFVLYSLLLTIGWFVNSLVAPAYFTNLGVGHLKWNLISSAMIAVLNGILGFVLGVMYGGDGVVSGWVLALIFGSITLIISFHRNLKLPLRDIFPSENTGLTMFCIIGIIATWEVYELLYYSLNSSWVVLVCISIYALIIVYPGWKHPMRKRLFEMFLTKRQINED